MSEWTLSELAELAARALAGAQPGVANGRVTEVPDGRLIRWYATIGLVDRPVLGSGRVARYGVRHLLQLVAVKRLQAQGLPLAQIQARLVGATEHELRQVAALPDGLLDGLADQGRTAKTDTPGREAKTESQARTAETDRFWTRRPATTRSPAPSPIELSPVGALPGRVHGVRLGELTLLLPTPPDPADLPAIEAAARPLLDLLTARGLLNGGQPRPGSAGQPGSTSQTDPREGDPA